MASSSKHVLITAPDPVEAIKFRMYQSGLSVKDLEPLIGKSNRVYEVLSRKRPLTLAMIRTLHKSLGIPADVLIAETAEQKASRPRQGRPGDVSDAGAPGSEEAGHHAAERAAGVPG